MSASTTVAAVLEAIAVILKSIELAVRISAISAGENYTLSEKPSYMIKANSGSRVTSEKVYGVDQTEMGVTNGPAHAGWVAVHTIGSGGSQRKQYETLVALSSAAAGTMGDAEDTEFADS